MLDKEFYLPSDGQLAAQSTLNRQGRARALTNDEAQCVLSLLRRDADRNYADYLWMLNEDESGNVLDEQRSGLARELARINLTLNMYTQWYWKIDLHNLLHFNCQTAANQRTSVSRVKNGYDAFNTFVFVQID